MRWELPSTHSHCQCGQYGENGQYGRISTDKVQEKYMRRVASSHLHPHPVPHLCHSGQKAATHIYCLPPKLKLKFKVGKKKVSYKGKLNSLHGLQLNETQLSGFQLSQLAKKQGCETDRDRE